MSPVVPARDDGARLGVRSPVRPLRLQELQDQLSQRADQYHRVLDQGESMLLARGGEEAGPGTTQTQQNLSMLQNKWAAFNTKMDDRRVRPPADL